MTRGSDFLNLKDMTENQKNTIKVIVLFILFFGTIFLLMMGESIVNYYLK